MPPKKKRDDNDPTKKKIISVTMTNAIVTKIDELVSTRVGRSRAQVIEDAVRWFLDFSVHSWNERGIFVKEFRFALEPESLSSLFFSKLRPVDQYELGETAGSQAPIADIIRLFHGQEINNVTSRTMALQMLQKNGWGSMRIQGDLIMIANPFYPASFLRGYLESLLKLNLEAVETNVQENIAFKIIGEKK